MTVLILMLLAAGDAVVISEMLCPRHGVGCCYRQGLNLLAFTIHSRLQSLHHHCCCYQTWTFVSMETGSAQDAPSVTLKSSALFQWRLVGLFHSSKVAFIRLPIKMLDSVSHNPSGPPCVLSQWITEVYELRFNPCQPRGPSDLLALKAWGDDGGGRASHRPPDTAAVHTTGPLGHMTSCDPTTSSSHVTQSSTWGDWCGENEVPMREMSLSGRCERGQGGVMSSLPRRLPRPSSGRSPPPSHSGTGCSSPEEEEEEENVFTAALIPQQLQSHILF